MRRPPQDLAGGSAGDGRGGTAAAYMMSPLAQGRPLGRPLDRWDACGGHLGELGLLDQETDRVRRVGRHQVRWTVRQPVEPVELIGIDRLQREMPLGQRLDARRVVELRPFRAQRRDGIVLALKLHPQLGKALRLERGFELDLVDISGSGHERRDDANVEEAHHRRLALTTSASAGKRGRMLLKLTVPAGASVRSAARSLAERDRALAAISAGSGMTGRAVRMRKLAAGRLVSGRWREPPPRRLREARKVFTMRSSSEWKAITTSRPPGLSTDSAAASAAASSCSSSFTKTRSAWKVRVAGWMAPGRAWTTRPTISASARVVRMGASVRARTIARATARAWRSSPSIVMIAARSRSEARATTSAAVAAEPPMRMSSGPSRRKEKPRSPSSSCIEETPRSNTMPSTASRPTPRTTDARLENLSSTSTSRPAAASTRSAPLAIAL